MKKLKNINGDGYIWPCIITVVLSMIAAVVMYFLVTVPMIKIQYEDTKKVLDSFIIENSIGVYNSVKVGEDEQLSLNSTAFTEKLSSFCFLDRNGDTLYSYDEEGQLRYSLTEPTLTSESNLKVTANYILSVPIYFNGNHITTADIPMKINAYYTEKF